MKTQLTFLRVLAMNHHHVVAIICFMVLFVVIAFMKIETTHKDPLVKTRFPEHLQSEGAQRTGFQAVATQSVITASRMKR